MFAGDPAQAQAFSQSQQFPGARVDAVREQALPVRVEAQEPPVKKRVQMRAEQKPVEHVEPFGIGNARRPRFGVAGAEQLRHRHARHRAGPAPILEERLAKEILPDPQLHHPKRFGRIQRFCALSCLGKLEGCLVGEGAGEFRRAPQQPAEPDFIRHGEFPRSPHPVRKRPRQFTVPSPGRIKCHPPTGCPGASRENPHPGGMPCGEEAHLFGGAFADVLEAVSVAGFFNEGAFEGVHGVGRFLRSESRPRRLPAYNAEAFGSQTDFHGRFGDVVETTRGWLSTQRRDFLSLS